MAKKMTVGKRDNDKRKNQKRQEKQKRKDERKLTGSRSFEDMIAYVDENGMITSTPPDLTKKKEIDIDSILVSTPEKVYEEPTPLNGRVEHFNSSKGYGFIKDIGSVEKYFFHISNAPVNIAEGNMVTFELERGNRGMNAINIKLSNPK